VVEKLITLKIDELKPEVLIIKDKHGVIMDSPIEINLSSESNRFIIKNINED